MLTAPVGLRAAVLAAFLLTALSLWPTPAAGQVLCGPQNKLADQLKQRFGETRQAMGVSTDAQRIIELFMAPDGSWTIVVTDTRGRSCIVLAGEDWTQAPQPQGMLPQSPREPHTDISWGWVEPPTISVSRAPVGDAGGRQEPFGLSAAAILDEIFPAACLMGSLNRWA